MAGETIIVKEVLSEFPTSIVPKIGGEPTREILINLNRLIIGNVVSVASNLGGGRNEHLILKMIAKEYKT